MAFINLIDNRTNPFLMGGEAMGGGMSGGSYAGIAAAGISAALIGALSEINKSNLQTNQKPPATESTPTTPLPSIEELPQTDYTYENAIKVPERDATIALAPESTTATETETVAPPSGNIPDVDEPDIKDKTEENVSQTLNYESYIDFVKEIQQAQWEREDKIRAETQAREDNAYQRATEDMLKAGINPNLVGIQPAQSGGGITQATGLNTDILGKAIDQETQYMIKMIEQNWKGDQNDLDRFISVLGDVIGAAGQIGMAVALSKAKKK